MSSEASTIAPATVEASAAKTPPAKKRGPKITPSSRPYKIWNTQTNARKIKKAVEQLSTLTGKRVTGAQVSALSYFLTPSSNERNRD